MKKKVRTKIIKPRMENKKDGTGQINFETVKRTRKLLG